MNNILVLHFTHPEGYPPALNAINCLSRKADQLKVISTDTLPTRWTYNENIELILLKGEHNRFHFVQRSKWQKVKTYISYVKQIRKQLKVNKPGLVLVYDNVPFLLYLFARLFIKQKHRLWYHNHDIYPLNHYPKFSINWFAFIAIQKYFNKIDFFSIPSKEREKMFPIQEFKGKSFFIPNYPSKKIVKASRKGHEDWKKNKYLKIIYPGSPSNKNGFEELINVMSQVINGKTVTLTIVGETNERYKSELINYAKSKGVANQLFFEKRVPYTEMSRFLTNYHIGWSIYKPKDMRTATVATASNKIYEFQWCCSSKDSITKINYWWF